VHGIFPGRNTEVDIRAENKAVHGREFQGHLFGFTTFIVAVVAHFLFFLVSSLVIAFLPRSKRLLISWLQSCLKHIKLYFLSGSLQMPEMLCP